MKVHEVNFDKRVRNQLDMSNRDFDI
jgi:hypothetical protein